ncbi:unnamed protein product [Cyprideis torosa]|uniref:Rad50/SbcC-type AAA domain-containing protein n=1 Tax=Cyprideis torosa TaxID=163714 RepID=A0A7R8ZPH5_9CRUS|nr:unnamed protein product [Cyprideis torosa]CAG0893940.1 unnamed protein product [Cyprideis torosa]
MTHIESVTIRGIRTFSAKQDEKVPFKTPLTIILGDNGCGKTTIIECLKYGAIGEFPPNSSMGKTFVRDPRKTATSSVNAKVTLSLLDRHEKPFVVSRILEGSSSVSNAGELKLSVRAKDVAVKKVGPGGIEQHMTRKVADANVEISGVLGVSPAVINNVIFCHQEDSNWPLDESKKVKEKFDAIFSMTNYMKCLEEVRAKKKDFQDKLKVMREGLEQISFRVKQVERFEKQLEDKRHEIEVAEFKKRQMERCKAPKEKEIQDVETELAAALSVKDKIERKKADIQGNQEFQDDLKAMIRNEYSGTVEQLEEEIRNFSARVTSKQDRVDELASELGNVSREKEELEEQRYQLREEKSHLEAAEKAFQACEQDLKQTGKAAAQEYKLPCESTPKALIRGLEVEVGVKERKTKELQENWERKIREQQAKVDDLRREESSLSTEVKLKEQKNEELSEKRKAVDVQMASLRVSRLDLDVKSSQLERFEKELDELNESYNEDSLADELKLNKEQRDELEKEVGALASELDDINSDVENRSVIENLQHEIFKKEEIIKELQEKNRDSFSKFFSDDVRVPEYEEKLKAGIREREETVRESQKAHSKAKQEVAKLSTSEEHIKNDLKKKEAELREKEDQLVRKLGGEQKTVQETIDAIRQEIQHLEEQSTHKETLARAFVQLGEKAKQNPSQPCLLCRRNFNDESEKENMWKTIEKVKKFASPEEMKRKDEELVRLRLRLDELTELKGVEFAVQDLKENGIPNARKSLQEIQGRVNEVDTQAGALEKSRSDLERELKMAWELQGDVREIQSAFREKEEALEKLELKKRFMDTKKIRRNPETVRRAKSVKESDLRAARVKVEELENRRNRFLEQRERMVARRAAAVEEMSKVNKLISERDRLEKSKVEIADQLKVIGEEILSLKQRLPVVDGKLRKAEKLLADLLMSSKTEQEQHRESLDKVKKSLEDLKNLNQRCDEFLASGQQDRLRSMVSEMDELQDKLSKVEKQIQDIRQKQDVIKDELANQKAFEQELKNSLKLLQRRSEREVLEKELEELKNDLGNRNVRELQERRRTKLEDLSELQYQIAAAEGQLKELTQSLTSVETQLKHRDLSNVKEEYRKKSCEENLVKIVITDLEKYFKALCWSISKYHETKLELLNQIIRDLWRRTYRGGDIEYIEVQADAESGGGVTKSGVLRAKFNYRVVMVKELSMAKKEMVASGFRSRNLTMDGKSSNLTDDNISFLQKMDMRGRCSAGQKVLASLIIRLALAQTFGAQCGILTLDEPTTNLDSENIDSLAKSLASIVQEYQRRNSSAQLIVITHDVEFVRMLCDAAESDQYVEVKRRPGSNTTQVIEHRRNEGQAFLKRKPRYARTIGDRILDDD